MARQSHVNLSTIDLAYLTILIAMEIFKSGRSAAEDNRRHMCRDLKLPVTQVPDVLSVRRWALLVPSEESTTPPRLTLLR
jgi:hypothetical protein